MIGLERWERFVAARLDEEQRAARAATPGPWRVANVTDYKSATVDGADTLQDGGYDEATKARRQVMRPLTVIPPDVDYGPTVDLGDAEHIARHDPARVLWDVEARRRILARHSGEHHCPEPDGEYIGYEAGEEVEIATPCGDLRDLAAAWADHPEHPERQDET